MENNSLKYWNEIHSKYTSTYDGWLNKYVHLFESNFCFIELGCGRAYCSTYLLDNGFGNVIACDFSKEAIKAVKKENPIIETMSFDMSLGLPFENNSKNVIIADLCLHYFDYRTTKFLFNEIYRVLKKDGYLIARVNSTNDSFQLSKQLTKIEENFYYNGILYKRFFAKKDLYAFFDNFEVYNIKEEFMSRYKNPKTLWEFCIKKV